MNWDDLRFVLVLASSGSLSRASKVLGVDHTTVGRRVEAAERALGVRLFTRTKSGYVLTADADRLLGPMKDVEQAVLALERRAHAEKSSLEGVVRVTSPETFGVAYLAPRLATFGRKYPGLRIELVAAGEVLDLGRRQAEVAVRPFRSTQENLLVRRAGEIVYGLYASRAYLARHPVKSIEALADHPILGAPENDVEAQWLTRLNPRVRVAFVSTLSISLLEAARASAGIAVIPRYLGDPDPALSHIPMPDPPSDHLWLTVHKDLRNTPRVRALLDFLAASFKHDAALLRGAR